MSVSEGAFLTIINPERVRKHPEAGIQPYDFDGSHEISVSLDEAHADFLNAMEYGLVDAYLPKCWDLLRIKVMKRKKSGKLKKVAEYKVRNCNEYAVELITVKKHSEMSIKYCDDDLEDHIWLKETYF